MLASPAEKIRTKPKGAKTSPLISLSATDAERLSHTPKYSFNGRYTDKTSVIGWLKQLESEYSPSGAKKSEKQKQKDKYTLSKFWNIAKQRRLLRNLFSRRISEAEISREMTKQGFPMSHERIRQIKEAWGLGSRIHYGKAIPEEKIQRLKLILTENPYITYDALEQQLNLSKESIRRIVDRFNLRKENPKLVTEEEFKKRMAFISRGGMVAPKRFYVRSEDLAQRARFLVENYGFFPTDARMLRSSSEKMKEKIDYLESLGVDWQDERISQILISSIDYIRNQMDIISVVGGTSELHHLLRGNLYNKKQTYLGEKYSYVRGLVLKRDIPNLAEYVRRLAINIMVKKMIPVEEIYLDVAQSAFVEVLHDCKTPEKDPAGFLALVSANISTSILVEYKKQKRTGNIDDVRGL